MDRYFGQANFIYLMCFFIGQSIRFITFNGDTLGGI